MTSKSDRRERQIERTRQDILEAAARAFAKNGFAGATIQDIAAEAGFTPPTLYSYFEGKEQILEAMMLTVTGELIAAFDEDYPAGLSLAQKLDLLMRRALEVADRRREAFTVFFAIPGFGGSVEGRAKAQGFGILLQTIGRWFERHASKGDLRGRPPEELALVLIGVGYGFMIQWMTDPKQGRFSARAQSIVSYFVNGALGPTNLR